MTWLEPIQQSIGALGVLVIMVGVAVSGWRFARAEIAAVRGAEVSTVRRQLRHALGYYLLLGLEFLIAADIIDTLMKPTVQDLIVLGAVVAIRTVISYSLNAELKHGQPDA